MYGEKKSHNKLGKFRIADIQHFIGFKRFTVIWHFFVFFFFRYRKMYRSYDSGRTY
jgi:hypothetical protein